MYPSTAKQRLWLTCLGFDFPAAATGNESRRLFEEVKGSGRYRGPATESQQRLARELALQLDPEATCYDVAGRLYRLLLLRAWVYSVHHARLGSTAGRYSDLGLPDESAVAVARQMLDAGMFERVEQYGTTDGRESDVFYRMSISAQQSTEFAFVVARLPASAGVVSALDSLAAAASSHRNAPKAGRGCLVLVAMFFAGVATCGVLL
jgi:hypothetical protein